MTDFTSHSYLCLFICNSGTTGIINSRSIVISVSVSSSSSCNTSSSNNNSYCTLYFITCNQVIPMFSHYTLYFITCNQVIPVVGEKALEDSSVSDQFGDQYFKEFDFLDNEAEHIDDENEDKFNWGVKRQHSLNELDLPEVTKQDVLLQRIALRKQEKEPAQETESSGAKSTSDEGDEQEVISPRSTLYLPSY